jgi:hypothetical protein
MGQAALLPLRRKACWEFSRPKNPTASAGFEPSNLGTKGQHATSRPPKPLMTHLLVSFLGYVIFKRLNNLVVACVIITMNFVVFWTRYGSILVGRIEYSRTPLIRMLGIRTANYPERLGPTGNFVENSTQLTCLEIIGYRIKYSTVLWLLEL